MASIVSVIIPAYNAEETIAKTITSALNQTYRACEVIVVDDGSKDATAEIVRDFMRSHEQVRLVRQENGGVARARNRGIANARGDYIAPLDADDIWHPEKIARQVAALEHAPEKSVLAYSWSRRIDADDLVFPGSISPRLDGWLFYRHLGWNFIYNGSTPLIHKDAGDQLFYDPILHDKGWQGCEDYLIQLRLAQTHRFVCAPGFLVGYRLLEGSMSRNVERMARSHLLMLDQLEESLDAPAHWIATQERGRLHTELAMRFARLGQWGGCVANLWTAMGENPRDVVRAVLRKAKWLMNGQFFDADDEAEPRRSFWRYGPDELDTPDERDEKWVLRRSMRRLTAREALDRDFAQRHDQGHDQRHERFPGNEGPTGGLQTMS